MSKAEKAEQRALEAYPVLMCYNDFQMVEEDINKPIREIYQEGYHQAEEDNELTWDDISELNCLLNEVEHEFKKGMHEDKSYTGYCQEVLKRFKDFKKGKSNDS